MSRGRSNPGRCFNMLRAPDGSTPGQLTWAGQQETLFSGVSPCHQCLRSPDRMDASAGEEECGRDHRSTCETSRGLPGIPGKERTWTLQGACTHVCMCACMCVFGCVLAPSLTVNVTPANIHEPVKPGDTGSLYHFHQRLQQRKERSDGHREEKKRLFKGGEGRGKDRKRGRQGKGRSFHLSHGHRAPPLHKHLP